MFWMNLKQVCKTLLFMLFRLFFEFVKEINMINNYVIYCIFFFVSFFVAGAKTSKIVEKVKYIRYTEYYWTLINKLWGCQGFDIVIDRFGLRVRELFSVINGQIKINDKKVVSLADYRASKVVALKAA